VNFELTPEQHELVEATRAYARDVVVPQRARLDEQVTIEGFPWDVVEPGARLGLKALPLPAEHGGRGADAVTLCLVAEELAAGDLGVCYFFRHFWRFGRLLQRLAPRWRDWVLDRIANDDRFAPASAVTEPLAGSDNALPYDAPGHGASLSATRDGDGWILDGRKAMITNAGLASVYFVFARTDPTVGIGRGMTHFVVPADAPGLSTGPLYDKLGQRASPQADVVLDRVRVEGDQVVGEVGEGMRAQAAVLVGPNITNAATALGVARAAYEEALDFSLDRVQGGVPIWRHQLVAHELGSIRVQLDAMRSHVLRVAWAFSHDPSFDPALAWGVRVFATDLAIEITRRVVLLFGGRGIMSAWPVEKLARDALTLTHGNGTNALMLLKTGTRAAEQRLAAREGATA
jgi:alkylation response protein AidB-like acyl-CoA dehydrogenase